MRVRQIEQPSPWDENLPPGYFSPPPQFVVGNEWRLIQRLRDAAAGGSAVTILTDAVVAQVQEALAPSSSQGLGMALADLAVSGRRAFTDFAFTVPREGGPIEAAALGTLTVLGTPGVTPALIRKATSEVLDRAYQVAWFLRAQTARGGLGWIAVSGEDDLPHRPVNVPRTSFPQHDLFFTVPGDLGEVVVHTRYAIATATEPVATTVSLPQRRLPPVLNPSLPEHDRIILFINGSDSRLEEANDLIPKLVRLPDGRPSGFTVIAMDLPGSGYMNVIDHTEVGPWAPIIGWIPIAGDVGAPVGVPISLLPFMEKFIIRFVATLSTQLGQPGLVESRIAAVIGGSLGGNLALRLARRSVPWLRNVIAWSPGSVWPFFADPKAADPISIQDTEWILSGESGAIARVGLSEDSASRDGFFAGVFDQGLPPSFKTQPEMWYRDDFPAKSQYITSARLDRRETYTSQFRRWHWRISLEELVWSWRNPSVQDFRSRILLGAGSADDIQPVHIFTNTRKLAAELDRTDGDTFFFDRTGHSIHAERPEALAGKIMAFLEEPVDLARPVPAIWELPLLEEPVDLARPVPATWELLLHEESVSSVDLARAVPAVHDLLLS